MRLAVCLKTDLVDGRGLGTRVTVVMVSVTMVTALQSTARVETVDGEAQAEILS